MKYNVYIYTVVFFAYFGCKRCGGKPDSFVAAVDNQQGFAEETGFGVQSPRTSRQFDNWFPVSAQKENTNENYADKEPAYKNPSYSFSINKLFNPVFSRFIVDIKNRRSSGDNQNLPFINSGWPFAYPLPILRKLIQSDGKKQIAIRIRAKIISNAQHMVPTFDTLLINPFTRLRSLYYDRSNIKDKQENTEDYKYLSKGGNLGDNLEVNFPSPTGIFSRSVNNNLGKNNFYNLVKNLNITRPTRRSVFKHFIRYERNPCYSEYVNASGVYYYYDIVRVLKYLHGYSGWSDEPTTNNQNKDQEENKITHTSEHPEFVSTGTSTVNNEHDNGLHKNQDVNLNEIKPNTDLEGATQTSYNKHDKARPTADQELAKILKPEMKYFSKFQNEFPTKEQSPNVINKIHRDETLKDSNERTMVINSVINSSPYNNIFQSLREQPIDTTKQSTDEGQNVEQMKHGNVYANPDGHKDYLNILRDNPYKPGAHSEDNPSINRYIRPREDVLMDTIDRLNAEFYNKIATIKKYTNNYDKNLLTPGNVYANPDERD